MKALQLPIRRAALAALLLCAAQAQALTVDPKALAVLSAKRVAALPDLPTFEEVGVKGVDVSAWQGLFVPKGTPEAIVSRLTADTLKALAQPDVRSSLEAFGLEVMPTDGPALARFIQEETRQWHALIRSRGITAE